MATFLFSEDEDNNKLLTEFINVLLAGPTVPFYEFFTHKLFHNIKGKNRFPEHTWWKMPKFLKFWNLKKYHAHPFAGQK